MIHIYTGQCPAERGHQRNVIKPIRAYQDSHRARHCGRQAESRMNSIAWLAGSSNKQLELVTLSLSPCPEVRDWRRPLRFPGE